MVLGPIMMIVFIAATIVVAALLVRWLSGDSPIPPPPSYAEKTPLDILKERFARGELDKEEFDQRRGVLGE